jgi:hypothetical protein
MLEKMARRLAQDALERVKPGTYTSVVDGVGLYQMLDGNYQVGERLGAGDEDAPGISYETAREAMVAMMAEQAGALVVVPEDAPADPYLAQIAQLLVDSADVPTDASDVANGAAIVGTVKRALDYLDAARDDNRIKREKIAKLELLLEESRNMNKAAQAEIERLNNQVQNWTTGANELQDKYLAAQQEIGSLTAKLDTAKRTIKRWEDEAANNQARYEGMGAALRIVLELAGVGK